MITTSKCMSFTDTNTYGKYKHLHSSGSLGVPATSNASGGGFDFIEVNTGISDYNTSHRLNASISKTSGKHTTRMPVDGNTYTSSSLQPCICVYFWKRIS